MLLIEGLEYVMDVFLFNLYAKYRNFSGPEVVTSQPEVTTFWIDWVPLVIKTTIFRKLKKKGVVVVGWGGGGGGGGGGGVGGGGGGGGGGWGGGWGGVGSNAFPVPEGIIGVFRIFMVCFTLSCRADSRLAPRQWETALHKPRISPVICISLFHF